MPSTRFFHFLLFSLLLPLAAPARVWHVKADATGANTGLTWADAFHDLQDGLRAAEAGDEVWVARGVYAPTKTADRNISFALKSGIGLYGGFGGWEDSLAQRNGDCFGTNRTVLSGKIGSGLQSYHVLSGRNLVSVSINCFFIIEGLADAPIDTGNDSGGAMYLESLGALSVSNIEVNQCLIQGNQARNAGGAICLYGFGGGKIELSVSGCAFWGNKSSEGGAISCFSGHGSYSLSIDRCTFAENAATFGNFHLNSGGAIFMSSNFSQNDQLKVRGCAFQGNEAKMMGGAIGINRTRMNGYVVEISDCEFSNNKSGSAGGAIYVQLRVGDHQKKLATFDFNNCHFNNNRAGGMGGAFCQITEPLTGAATTLSHCSFSKNQVSASEGNLRTDWLQNRERIAAAGGAVAAVFQNEPDSLTTFRLYDCQFEENASAGVGGACYVESAQPDRVPVQFFDAVFNKNTAPEGSAIYHNALSKPLKLTGSNLPEGGVGQVAGATQRVFWEKALPKTPAEKPKGKWITDEKGNRIFSTFGN